MDFSELETRELGTYFEHLLISKLIKKFEIYVPLIDKGIDFIVRKTVNGLPKYFEFQVKSVRKRGGRLTIRKDKFCAHENLFLVFFNIKEKEDYEAYLIPSKVVHNNFRHQVQGKNCIPIYRLYTTRKHLEKIEDYKWNDLGVIPEVWKS